MTKRILRNYDQIPLMIRNLLLRPLCYFMFTWIRLANYAFGRFRIHVKSMAYPARILTYGIYHARFDRLHNFARSSIDIHSALSSGGMLIDSVAGLNAKPDAAI